MATVAVSCVAVLLLLFVPASSSNVVLIPDHTGINRSSFPADFLFGAITSSMKHEGAEYIDGKTDNIWDVYARREGAIDDGALPGQCGDNYNRYKTDNQLLTDLGMDAYRFSIAWSRIYPNGSGEVNELAIAHYNDVIDSVLEAGLEPFVTLWTQDHPHILDVTYLGPLSRQYVDDFARYAKTCFEAFGDRVKNWITFDEPNDFAGMGYATDQNPPGRCTPHIIGQCHTDYGNCPEGNSGTEPYIVGHHLLLAHAEAVDIYREKYQEAQNGSIGMALWFRWPEPLTTSQSDAAASQRAIDFLVGWFLDPIFFGDYPASMRTLVGSRLPNFTHEEIGKVKGSLDFIGLNIQTSYSVFEHEFYTPTQTQDLSYFLDWRVNGSASQDTELVPWCMSKAVEYNKVRYGNFPTYVTQTGWGILFNSTNNTLEDETRIEYFDAYYYELSVAIRNGANVKGVFAWSLMDGFEFDLGLSTRVGLYYVDSNLERYPRDSTLWFKEILAKGNSTISEKVNILGQENAC